MNHGGGTKAMPSIKCRLPSARGIDRSDYVTSSVASLHYDYAAISAVNKNVKLADAPAAAYM
jgi:hypothetical protein